MKNKTLIIGIIVAIIVIALAGGGFMYYQNTQKKAAQEYDEAVKKFERVEKISNDVNTAIDKEVKAANDFIATNPDVGEDKTSIDDLKKTVSDLEGLKISIPAKSEKTDELNSAVEDIENKIKQVDEELLKVDFKIDDNKEEIKFSENSNFSILTSNIKTQTEKVNEAVKAETERKAEAEKKAKEEAEKKAKEEALSAMAGTYAADPNGGSLRAYLKIYSSGSAEILAWSPAFGNSETTKYSISLSSNSSEDKISFTLIPKKGGTKQSCTFNRKTKTITDSDGIKWDKV